MLVLVNSVAETKVATITGNMFRWPGTDIDQCNPQAGQRRGDYVVCTSEDGEPTGSGTALRYTTDEFVLPSTWRRNREWYTPVPQAVSARQARLALEAISYNGGTLLDLVDAYVAQQSKEVQISWEFANEIERNNPILVAAQAVLGWTDQQMDDLFIAAGAIQ